jgi:hypothetical protein
MKKIWYINYSKTSSFFARFNPAIHYSFFHRNPNITTFGTVYGVTENQNFNVGFVNGLIDFNYLENNITGSGRLTSMNNQGFLPNGFQRFNMEQNNIGTMPFLLRSGSTVRNSNNNVALDFNGGNYFMQPPGSSANHGIKLLDKDCTMFVVFRSQNNASIQPVMFEGVGGERIGTFASTDTTSPYRHSVTIITNSNIQGLNFSSQQPQSTNRILTFRRNDASSNLIEAFDESFNLVDSLTNALKYTGTPTSNPVSLFLGRQPIGINNFFDSLWLETIIFDKTLSNTEAQDVLNVLKSDFNVS